MMAHECDEMQDSKNLYLKPIAHLEYHNYYNQAHRKKHIHKSPG